MCLEYQLSANVERLAHGVNDWSEPLPERTLSSTTVIVSDFPATGENLYSVFLACRSRPDCDCNFLYQPQVSH